MSAKQKPPGSWYIQFFRRHRDDDLEETVPGIVFLRGGGKAAAIKLQMILQSVAAAPPPSWSGGGTWEAMKDEMAGYYEARTRLGTGCTGSSAFWSGMRRVFQDLPSW